MRHGPALALVGLGLAAVGLAGLATGCGSGAGHSATAQRSERPRRVVVRRRVQAHPYRKAVPILMYHETRAPAAALEAELYVKRSSFRGQMRWLRRHGFHAVTLARVEDAWRGRAALPRRPIVLSFDDGYRSTYDNAFPIMRRLHWPGVLDLAIDNMGTPMGVTRAEVRRLIAAGWELASHTISHLDLPTLPARRLRKEVAGSRRLLRRWFHVPVENFAYPSGRYDRQVVVAVKRAGYRGAVTVAPGLARRRPRFEMDRIRVDRSDGVRGLAAKLRALGE